MQDDIITPMWQPLGNKPPEYGGLCSIGVPIMPASNQNNKYNIFTESPYAANLAFTFPLTVCK
jgi:hypothetical protein